MLKKMSTVITRLRGFAIPVFALVAMAGYGLQFTVYSTFAC